MDSPRRCVLAAVVCMGLAVARLEAAESTPAAVATEDAADLLAQARELHHTDSTRSRELAEKGLALAVQRGDRKLEALGLVEMAIALRRQNRNGVALQHIRQALALAPTVEDRPLLRRTLKEAGHTYWAFGDNVSATDYFQRALQLSEEDNDIVGQIDSLAGLGVAASGLRDRERSAQLTARALALAEQSGDPLRIAMYGSNLAHRHADLGEYDTARRLYERSLGIFEQLSRRTDAADCRYDLARLDFREGKLEAAEAKLREILPGRRRLRGKIKLTATLVTLADVLRTQRRFDEAAALLTEAGTHSAELAPASRLRVLESLVELHEARGDLPAALAAMRELRREADESYGRTAQERAAEVRENFEAERREAEIARLREAERSRTSELRAKEAELGRHAAELRAREAEIERARSARLALAGTLGAGLVALGAIVALLRLRLRTERRIHAETRVAKEAAEQADRIKTRFLGVASHDIRGPLGNISNLASLLRSDLPDRGQILERSHLISAEAERVITLDEDFITTAALEEGRLELRLAPVDLVALAHSVLESLRWQAEAKRQRLVFEPAPTDSGLLAGDAPRLRQIVANLVSNALKFSPAGTEIRLRFERRDDRLRFSVTDRGPGIAPAELARLFRPFERLSSQPTAGESSHGLGLSIAQEIARRHGGVILVDSQPGQGSTFTLELPAAASSAPASPPPN